MNTSTFTISILHIISRQPRSVWQHVRDHHQTWVHLSNLATPSQDEPTTLTRLYYHSPGVPPTHPPEVQHHVDTPLSAVLSHSTDSPAVVRLHLHALRLQVHDGSVRRQHLHWKRLCCVLLTPADRTRTQRCWPPGGSTGKRLCVPVVNIPTRPHESRRPKVRRRCLKVTFETSAARSNVARCPCC